MKKSLITIAVLAAFAGTAFAESSLTVYGKVDVGLVGEGGAPAAGKTLKVSSGVSGGSRLGFRGVEDLGGGVKGRFQIETGFCADSAADDNNNDDTCGGGGKLFGRMAIVALDGSFGSIQLGRQYSPMFMHQAMVDPFNDGLAGQMENLFPINKRIDNSVAYSTPNIGGFQASLLVGAGEATGDTSNSRTVDGSVSYAAGPLYIGFSYGQKNDVDLVKDKNVANAGVDTMLANVGATYDFGMAKGHLMYQKSESENTAAGDTKVNEFDTTLIGVSLPLGQGNLMASYIQHDDKLNAIPNDSHQTAIGYMYALSKRTQLYAAYAKINNKNGAQKTVGNDTDKGTGDKAVNVGVVHNF